MCLITEEIEKKCKGVPESDRIFEDWESARRDILESLPFERIGYALTEIDTRFEKILDYAREFSV